MKQTVCRILPSTAQPSGRELMKRFQMARFLLESIKTQNDTWYMSRKTHKSEQKMDLQGQPFAAAVLMLSECMLSEWSRNMGWLWWMKQNAQSTGKTCLNQESFPKSLYLLVVNLKSTWIDPSKIIQPKLNPIVYTNIVLGPKDIQITMTAIMKYLQIIFNFNTIF